VFFTELLKCGVWSHEAPILTNTHSDDVAIYPGVFKQMLLEGDTPLLIIGL
jgi:hypothetical protein